jgi:nitrate reductase NapAB chaperone NapD
LFHRTGKPMTILGVIVRCQAAQAAQTQQLVAAMPGLDIAATEQGRFVAVIEDSADASAAETLARIALLPQVLNTSLVYEYCGPDSPAPEGDSASFEGWRAHPETWIRQRT